MRMHSARPGTGQVRHEATLPQRGRPPCHAAPTPGGHVTPLTLRNPHGDAFPRLDHLHSALQPLVVFALPPASPGTAGGVTAPSTAASKEGPAKPAELEKPYTCFEL